MVTTSPTTSTPIAPPPPVATLSITQGGPLFSAARRLHVESPAHIVRLVLVVAAITWGGAMVLAGVDALTGHDTTVAVELGFHVRALVAIPLLLIADAVLERRAGAATRRLVAEGVVRGGPAWDRVVRQAERLRDMAAIDVAIVVVVGALTIAGLVNVVPQDLLRWFMPALHGRASSGSLSQWWYALVVQQLLLILVLYWLRHWLVWGYLLFSLRTVALDLRPSHPDRCGGLAEVAFALDAACAAHLGISAALAATWADEIARTGVQANAFAPYFVVWVIVAMVIAFGPYVLMVPWLFREKRAGLGAYSGIARDFVIEFEKRWLAPHDSDGAPPDPRDFSALADLGTSFSVVDEMRVVPFSPRDAVRVLAFSLAPIVLLVLSARPASELAKRIIDMLLI